MYPWKPLFFLFFSFFHVFQFFLLAFLFLFLVFFFFFLLALLFNFLSLQTIRTTRKHKGNKGTPSFQRHTMFKLYQNWKETSKPPNSEGLGRHVSSVHSLTTSLSFAVIARPR